MPPPAVGVMTIEARPLAVMNELPGRIAATRVSEVRAQVSGILQERVFTQGTPVTKGDVLYRIDARLFRARVASAEASLARARSTLTNARNQMSRQESLRKSNVTSGAQYEAAVAALEQANADVAFAQAALDEARINLAYTDVRAPISGIIGAALVTEGALVTADGSQNLALIQQIDPVYADFTQSAQQLLALRRAVNEGKLAFPAPGEARVELLFDDDSVYSKPGRLLFASASVDATTGQVTLRAEFPNSDGDLLPGMYVRVRVEQAVHQHAITIPQRAVLRTQDGRAQVYVVSADDTAVAREVRLGQVQNDEWLVEAGLKAGERVVIDGVQKVVAGGKVAAEPWNPAATNQKSAAQQERAPDQPAQ
ncbi:Secretion protein HlyD [Rhodospirillum rubrum ATCC 11170]|uniref:Secretion protein HlyD n=2 Tax=Rhodospirillum rubrum TaxID=1085 RepID=Q2RVC7_RHORT|nr:Secretion protein HlyD [Rhodospirillum rubrum ATCC 11170]